ncbi:MAG: 23S rRNA (guanosine(2251)-2'-O)-methyltransferase RlmB [Nitriliruptorales bacterium]|nr:23S rRNA (guanosine(2251)-2'-O)-methyltransferase RlmB [Nitriliruptorales bacterium]
MPSRRVVVGLHPVRELLRAGREVHEIHIADSRGGSDTLDDIVRLAGERGVVVHESPRDRVDDLGEGLVHQGVVAFAPPFRYATLDEAIAAVPDDEPALFVALDRITDPMNLGSIARTAEAAGAHGVIVPERRAAGVTPTVEKAAAGALAHLALVQVVNFVRALRTLGEAGIWSVGLDGDAPSSLYDSPLLTEPLVLVAGSEGKGLARSSHVQCDVVVSLPMRGQVGSLNASVATAVALFEVVRART